MTINNPSWIKISTVAQPVYSAKTGSSVGWTRFPTLIAAQGVGFGQGGFGQGGFGATPAQISGVSQPVWSAETIK